MSTWVREPAVSGLFYSDNSEMLAEQVDHFLFPTEPGESIRALMVPHAGLKYSGSNAGSAFRLVKVPDTVVILCPNHTGMGRKVSIWSEGSWKTPLGSVPIQEDLSSQFLKVLGERPDKTAHVREHAIEVQVPFIQRLNPKAKIVPMVVGSMRFGECEKAAEAMSHILFGFSEPYLLVASTDMSHYVPKEVAKEMDKKALSSVDRVDGKGLFETVVENEISMCGFIPTTITLLILSALGIKRSKRVAYSTSGDVTGDNSSVVSYASSLFY